MEYIDDPTPEQLGIMNPQVAFATGKVEAENPDELVHFISAFPLHPSKVLDYAERVKDAPNVTPKDKTDLIFKELLPDCFDPERAQGWKANLHFKIRGAGNYSVDIREGKATIQDGLVGAPTSEAAMDWDTWSKIIKFVILWDANLALPEQGDGTRARAALKAAEEEADEELSDEMLETVAGGKYTTVCGAEAAEATTGDATACGAAASAGTICEGQACAAAAGAGGACAADVCAAAVCAAAACLAAACGADVSVGPDIGPCAINVIPIIPGI